MEVLTDREKLAMASTNNRERRKIVALENIAANLETISTTLAMWYALELENCDVMEKIAVMGVKAPPDVEIKEKTEEDKTR